MKRVGCKTGKGYSDGIGIVRQCKSEDLDGGQRRHLFLALQQECSIRRHVLRNRAPLLAVRRQE